MTATTEPLRSEAPAAQASEGVAATVAARRADLGGVLSACAASLGRLPGINMAVDVDAYDMM